MPTYEVTDTQSRKTLRLVGDSPPTEEELQGIFSQYSPSEGARTIVPGSQAPTPQSALQHTGRQLGLTGRYLTEGVLSLPGLVADVPAAIGNLPFQAFDLATSAEEPSFRFPSQNQNISQALTNLGFPEPETAMERVIGAASRAVAGGGGFIGTGKALAGVADDVVSGLGRSLTSNPVLQGTGAVSGGGASEIASELGAPLPVQIGVGLGASVVPAVAGTAAPATVRGLFRGGEAGRQRTAGNLESFRQTGTTPTVGQATENRAARATESLLSRSPGGAGPILARARTQAEEVSARLEQRADELIGRLTSAEQTGRQIERSVRGEGGFVSRFKDRAKELYDAIDISPRAMVSAVNTKRALADLTRPVTGAEETSRQLINARIQRMQTSLANDMAGAPASESAILRSSGQPFVTPAGAARDTLPYEAIKRLRTMVGEELADAPLKGDVPLAQWRRLYAALSADLEAAASAAGPKAQQAYSRANSFFQAGSRRLEAIESVINRNGGPEKIFRAATAGTREGASTLRAVMQSVDDEGKKMITATVLRRLGLARAGVQGELGDQFSTETFLTNWNLLSAEAKRALFSRYGGTFRADMDQVARFAANLREGSQVFRNPSGTAQAQTQAATAGAFVLSVLTGQVAPAVGIAGAVTGANLISRLMINPTFVRWLATTTRAPVGAVPALANNLLQRARSDGDSDLAQFALLLQEGQQNQAQ